MYASLNEALTLLAKSGKKELVASTPEELLHEAKTQLAAYLQFAKNKYRNDLKLILVRLICHPCPTHATGY